MTAKAVVKDVARVLDVPYNEAANWVKEIPAMGKPLLAQVLTEGSEFYSEDFKRYMTVVRPQRTSLTLQ